MSHAPAAAVRDGRQVIGRYVMYGSIASGGMASVHLARLQGEAGFARTVAIKRLHQHLARDPMFVAMFLDEARVAARIHHPNVVSTLDVAAIDGEVLLVMEYIDGESLTRLIRLAEKRGGIPPDVVSGIFVGVLQGLQAAHDAKNERGEPLQIVHRDVSPQNVIVGADGVPRILDFGVAKAAGRLQETTDGAVKGKFSYMSPEQLAQRGVDRRTDVFAASILLWETLVGRKLFTGDAPATIVHAVLTQPVPPPSSMVPGLPREVDAVVDKGLARDPGKRYASALDMAAALEHALPPATSGKIARWMRDLAGDTLAERARYVSAIESDASDVTALPPPPSVMTSSGSMPTGGATSVPTIAEPASRSHAATALTMVEPVVPRSSGRRTAIVAGIVLALIGIGGAAVAVSRSRDAGATARGAVQERHVGDATETSTAETSSHPAVEPTAAATSTPGSSAASGAHEATAASDASAPSASARSTTVRTAWTARPPPPTKPTGAKPDCTNPFTIDASGKKRPRPECF